MRLQEARALFKAGQYSGSYYLAGYSVECALKACIAKSTQRYDFPDKGRVLDSFTHNFATLRKTARLDEAFSAAARLNPRLQGSWNQASIWSEQDRYKVKSKSEAYEMIDAVARRQDGVLSWIRRHW